MQILALLLAAALPQASLAGVYQIETMEVGGGLELRKDGHFQFAMVYGAIDEEAEGEWTFDGTAVRLTSKPMPKPPAFELVGDDPAPKGQLWLKIDWQRFNWSSRINAIGTIASGEQGMVVADADGRVDSGGHALVAIDPMVPMYGTIAGHFPLTGKRGHRLRLRFHANDLGRVAFRSEPLELSGRDLIFTRYDRQIRFVRVRP